MNIMWVDIMNRWIVSSSKARFSSGNTIYFLFHGHVSDVTISIMWILWQIVTKLNRDKINPLGNMIEDRTVEPAAYR